MENNINASSNNPYANSSIKNRLLGLADRYGHQESRVSRGRIDDLVLHNDVTDYAPSTDSSSGNSMVNSSHSGASSRLKNRAERNKLSRMRVFDENRDGVVSDKESLNYLIKLRRSGTDRGLSDLMNFNTNTQRINSNLASVDGDGNGVISDSELMNTMLNLRNQPSDPTLVDAALTNQDLAIINMILDTNSNKADIADLLNRVDTNPDGQISDEEVLAVLNDIRDNNLEPSLVEKLTPILKLNPNLESIMQEFENSIPDSYTPEQHAEAQVLITRRSQELQLQAGSSNDQNPSVLSLLEEVANIYGDNYLSEDENSPDFHTLNGISGEIEQAFLDQGYSIDQIINGHASAADLDLIFHGITERSPNQRGDIEASFAEQHNNVLEYLNDLPQQFHLNFDDNSDSFISLPVILNNIANFYGDLGFPGEDYSGFTGAIQEALSADYDVYDTNLSLGFEFTFNQDGRLIVSRIEEMLHDLPGVESTQVEPSPYTDEQNLNVFKLLEEYHQEAVLGGTETSNIDWDQTIPGLLKEIAAIYGDEVRQINSIEYRISGRTGKLMEALADNYIDFNSDTRPLSHFDMDFIENQLKSITGLEPNLDSNHDLHQSVLALVENKITAYEAGDQSVRLQTLPDILEEISQIYGDEGVPGSIDPSEQYTGFTSAIAKGLADFDIYDLTKPIQIEALDLLKDNLNRLLNEPEVDANLLAQMPKLTKVHSIVLNRMEEVILGGTDVGNINFDQSLPGLLGEIADVWGDSGVPGSTDEVFTGFTGEVMNALSEAGFDVFADTVPLTTEPLNLIMSKLAEKTNNYDFSDMNGNINIRYSEVDQFHDVQSLLRKTKNDIQTGVDPNWTYSTVPRLLGGIADIFGYPGIPGSTDPTEQFGGLTSAIQKGLAAQGIDTYSYDSMVTPEILDSIDAKISQVLQTYLDIGIVETIRPLEEPLTLEELLTQNSDVNGDGLLGMSDVLRLASMIHNPSVYANVDFVEGSPIGSPEAINFRRGVYNFVQDSGTNAQDLRAMIKFVDGVRGDDLSVETPETMQRYIENVLNTEYSVSFDSGINSYSGVFGPEITDADMLHLANIVQGNHEQNYPDGTLPIHGDHIEQAVNAGLLDINNDGITDMADVAILARYKNGLRGEELLNPPLNNIDQMVDTLVSLKQNYDFGLDIDGSGSVNIFTDNFIAFHFINGSRGDELSRYLGQGHDDISIIESRMHELAASGALDIDGDGLVSTRDAVLFLQYTSQFVAGMTDEQIRSSNALSIEQADTYLANQGLEFKFYNG